MERPTEMHLIAAKRVLKYLNGTMSLEFYTRRAQCRILKVGLILD
jgi:hypothetical protein